MLQICGDTDSSRMCYQTLFDFPTTNFMRNLLNCSQVVTWTGD